MTTKQVIASYTNHSPLALMFAFVCVEFV